MKRLLLLVGTLLCSVYANAQNSEQSENVTDDFQSRPYLQLGINKDFGLGYYTGPTYYSATGFTSTLFSPGGGMGVTLEGGMELTSKVSAGLHTNAQWVISGESYSDPYGDQSSAWSKMSRFSVTPRIDVKIIENADFVIEEIQIGGGPMYNSYGELRLEGEEVAGEIDYKSAWGWTMQLNFLMDYFNRDDITAIANIGYRDVQMRSVDSTIEREYRGMNGSGLNFHFGIRVYLK